MTNEEIRMQYRFTHHALVGLFKLCKASGRFDGDEKAAAVINSAEAVLRGDTSQIDVSDPMSQAFFSLLKSMAMSDDTALIERCQQDAVAMLDARRLRSQCDMLRKALFDIQWHEWREPANEASLRDAIAIMKETASEALEKICH